MRPAQQCVGFATSCCRIFMVQAHRLAAARLHHLQLAPASEPSATPSRGHLFCVALRALFAADDLGVIWRFGQKPALHHPLDLLVKFVGLIGFHSRPVRASGRRSPRSPRPIGLPPKPRSGPPCRPRPASRTPPPPASSTRPTAPSCPACTWPLSSGHCWQPARACSSCASSPASSSRPPFLRWTGRTRPTTRTSCSPWTQWPPRTRRPGSAPVGSPDV